MRAESLFPTPTFLIPLKRGGKFGTKRTKRKKECEVYKKAL